MLKRLPFLLLALLLSVTFSVHAQTTLQLETLDINLWPEFDKPSMLVIYDFTLSTDTKLPAQVSFRIPSAAGDAWGYGYYQTGQDKPIQERETYSRVVEGDWATISFQMRTLQGSLEYYDPSIQRNGQNRHFEYTWPGGYAVQTMHIAVRQPIDTNNMSSSTTLEKSIQNGVVYYATALGTFTTDQTYQLSLDYKKSSERLTLEGTPVQPAYPTPEAGLLRILPYLLGILGAVLLFGGVGTYWYLQSGHRFRASKAEQSAQGHRRRKGQAITEEEAVSDEPTYCHQCGMRASEGDRFCRSCGAVLRAE